MRRSGSRSLSMPSHPVSRRRRRTTTTSRYTSTTRSQDSPRPTSARATQVRKEIWEPGAASQFSQSLRLSLACHSPPPLPRRRSHPTPRSRSSAPASPPVLPRSRPGVLAGARSRALSFRRDGGEGVHGRRRLHPEDDLLLQPPAEARLHERSALRPVGFGSDRGRAVRDLRLHLEVMARAARARARCAARLRFEPILFFKAPRTCEACARPGPTCAGGVASNRKMGSL